MQINHTHPISYRAHALLTLIDQTHSRGFLNASMISASGLPGVGCWGGSLGFVGCGGQAADGGIRLTGDRFVVGFLLSVFLLWWWSLM